MNNPITVAQYPKSAIPERYIRIRDLKRACIICQHWTSRRDLRKDKRYIVKMEHGSCRLQHELYSCKSFRKIPELRGKNMTINEKLYATISSILFLIKSLIKFKYCYNTSLTNRISTASFILIHDCHWGAKIRQLYQNEKFHND